MDIGDGLIVTMETSTKVFNKDTTENLIKDYKRGLYLLFKIKPMVIGDRMLVVIGYKYNSQNFISFISTYREVITTPGNTYIYS